VEVLDLLEPLVVVQVLVVVVGVVVALNLGALAVELVLLLEDSLVQMIGLVQCKTIYLFLKFSFFFFFFLRFSLCFLAILIFFF
jgi:hypothetical protein